MVEAMGGNETIPSLGVCSFLNWIYLQSGSLAVSLYCVLIFTPLLTLCFS